MQVLETAIADQKVKAADDLSEVKVALEQSQEQAKVSLDHKVDQLAVRATQGEDRQVGFEQIVMNSKPKDNLVTLLQMNTKRKQVIWHYFLYT